MFLLTEAAKLITEQWRLVASRMQYQVQRRLQRAARVWLKGRHAHRGQLSKGWGVGIQVLFHADVASCQSLLTSWPA
jgi:hypothetical protein